MASQVDYISLIDILCRSGALWDFAKTPQGLVALLTNAYLWLGIGPIILTSTAMRAQLASSLLPRRGNHEESGDMATPSNRLTQYITEYKFAIYLFIHYYSLLVGILSFSTSLVLYGMKVGAITNTFAYQSIFAGVFGFTIAGAMGLTGLFLNEKLFAIYERHDILPGGWRNVIPAICPFNVFRTIFFSFAIYASVLMSYYLESLNGLNG